jgi:predicted permease
MLEAARFRIGDARGLQRAGRVAAAMLDLAWNALRMRTPRRPTRHEGGAGPMAGLGRGLHLDARFVARSVTGSPGYALTTVSVLAGAVAVTAAVFSFVRGTLLPAPTYPDADRVVVVWGSNPQQGQLRDVVSGPNYLDLRDRTTSLEALAAFHPDAAVLAEDGRPVVVEVNAASVDFFDAVPVEAAMGRVFGERDRTSSGPPVVLVSHGYWRDALGADPAAVGRAIPLNGDPHTVVGVLPRGFEFIRPAPFWLPLRDDVLAADDRSRIHYHLVGRLRAGATAPDATADLSRALDRVLAETTGWHEWRILVEPLHDASVMAVRPVLHVVTAAVLLVLIVALVNLTTLFRIRTLGRTRELAVRRALGAGRGRLGRVLALEAGGLATLGTVLGLLAAVPLLGLLRDLLPMTISVPESAMQVPALRAVLDPAVMAVAGALAIVGALALTLPAALEGCPPGGSSERRPGADRTSGLAGLASRQRSVGGRGTRGLVAAELALATILCLGALLTAQSAERLLATDVGIRDEGLLTLWFGNVWEQPVADQVRYFDEVVRAVEAVPGVESAALIDYLPFLGEDDFAGLTFLDRAVQPGESAREEWRRITPGLVETGGMRLVAGRPLVDDDLQGPPRVALVNESFARKHYPNGSPLGRFLSVNNQPYREIEIVGVVADVRTNGPAEPAPPILYVPLQGSPRGTSGMYVRASSGPPTALAEAVREAIWSVDASQPVGYLRPMSELVDRWVAIPRAVRALVSGMALFALALAALGVFGVVTYAVRARRAELGVRLALGASPGRLQRELLRWAVPWVALGVAVGLVAGVAAARAAGSVLVDVAPADPLAIGLALLTMAATALVAVWLPARRVAAIDPIEAMRE